MKNTNEKYILEVNGLEKNYPGFHLNNITFTLPKGYIMGLIGANGAGKTTIIRLLMNLAIKERGKIRLFGKTYDQHEREIHQKTGFVYESPEYYKKLKLKQTVSIIAPFYRDWDNVKFNSLCRSFNLDIEKKFKDLSKGARMKFSIALALSHNPELLILDEPTSGLDPVFRNKFLDILSDFLLDESHSVLYSTHITSDLEKNCDYITYIRNGKLIFSEEKDLIFEKWGIIKIPSNSEDVISTDILGKRVHNRIKEFLSGDIKKTEKELTGKAIIEKPSLEKIMVLMEEGDSND